LLANILLDDVDKELERRGHRFTRYADHLVILVKSHRAGERIMTSVTSFLIRVSPAHTMAAPTERAVRSSTSSQVASSARLGLAPQVFNP
jgi:retron-type reverse transcriptase